jgi:hypothetical protein
MARIGKFVRRFSEVKAMTENTKVAAYYAGVAQHPFDSAGPGYLLTGAAIAYAIVVIGLAAKLVLSNGPGWTMQEPVGSNVPSIASDLAATPAGLPTGVTDGTGYAGLEPPPATPAGPFASSHATAKQAHQSREPGDVRNRVAARASTFTGE